MSEEAFQTQCGDLYNSNLFGEDQSALVQQLAANKMPSSTQTKMNQLIKQAHQSNINSSQFYSGNKDWLEQEVATYLETNQNELDQKKLEDNLKQEMEVKQYLERVVNEEEQQQVGVN